MKRPRKEDLTERREREFDAITFLLAGVLSAIVLGAVGYGIFNSSKGVVATIPTRTEIPARQNPEQAERPSNRAPSPLAQDELEPGASGTDCHPAGLVLRRRGG
jgi:hypothetical protein